MRSRLHVASLSLLACLISVPAVLGQNGMAERPKCDAFNSADMADKALAAQKVTELSRSVFPSGGRVEVDLPVEWNANIVYCARVGDDVPPIVVVSARAGTEDETKAKMTVLTLQIPTIGSRWYRTWGSHRELSLVGFEPDSAGGWNYNQPQVGVRQTVTLTHALPARLGAILIVLLAYLLSVLSKAKRPVLSRTKGPVLLKAKRRRFRELPFDPIVITAGKGGRASLSKLQIFGFSLIVIYLLANFLLRYRVLTEISTDILYLLGISAAGTAGSKIAGIAKKRLSFENWSWLRNKGWLTDPPPDRARWSDLLKMDDEFDVYSFQLAAVSVVVGLALLTTDITTLSTFTIPSNLLALLGLSNVVYIGGKAIAPSVEALNEKVDKFREAEKVWMTQVFNTVSLEPTQQAKQAKAVNTAPEKYIIYIELAKEASRMLQTFYSKEETKFKNPEITVAELMPIFP